MTDRGRPLSTLEQWQDALTFIVIAGAGGLVGWLLRLLVEGGATAIRARLEWLAFWSLGLLGLCVVLCGLALFDLRRSRRRRVEERRRE